MSCFKYFYGVCLFLLIAIHLMATVNSLMGMKFLKLDGKTLGDGTTSYEKLLSFLLFLIYGGSLLPVLVSLRQPSRRVKQYAITFAMVYHTLNFLVLPFWQKNNHIFPYPAMYDGFVYVNLIVIIHMIMTIVTWTLFLGGKDNMILPTAEENLLDFAEQEMKENLMH